MSLVERGDSIRLFQIYSSVSGKDGLYRLFADCGTTISKKNMYIRVLYITYDIVPALSLCISRMNTRKGAVGK